jgi:hypothetical protein
MVYNERMTLAMLAFLGDIRRNSDTGCGVQAYLFTFG